MSLAVDISVTKSPYLFNNIITPDTNICRYMEFDLFLQIMEGDFYVPRKYTFIDLRESGNVPMNFRFAFNKVGGNCSKVNCSAPNGQDAIEHYIENLIQSKFLFTSCWAIDKGEDYLMWKSYTNRIGICVHTTIDKLMSSIDYDKEKYI